MNRRPSHTAACGSCRGPVLVTDRTMRGRYTQQPLCDRCATGPSPLEDIELYPLRAGRVPKSREQLEAEVSRLLGPRPDHRAEQERAEAIAAKSDVLLRLAYHESGHTITARALGLPIAEVTLDGDHDGVTRFDATQAPDGWTSSHDAAILAAGSMAERHWCPSSAMDGSEHDEQALRSMMDGDGPPDVRQALAMVERILGDHASDVETLAEALIKRQHLTGDEVDDLLGPAITQSARSAQGVPCQEARSMDSGPSWFGYPSQAQTRASFISTCAADLRTGRRQLSGRVVFGGPGAWDDVTREVLDAVGR